MLFFAMHLFIISDGKKGHENQSRGLAEAILRRCDGSYEIRGLDEVLSQPEKRPDAIIAAGHATHPFLLRLSRLHRCPSVVIMKPSLPSFLFSCCLVPQHDLKPINRFSKNFIVTQGALNLIPETIPEKGEEALIMLGGPCKHFEWKLPPILSAVEALVKAQPGLQWTLGDSRRTPAETLPAIEDLGLPITIAPHQEATGTWLVDRLLASRVAWITPDSTSMLFEALTAGCHLGTLPLQAKGTRLSRAHETLAKEGWLTPFANHDPASPLPGPPSLLQETARCAELLLAKLT